MQQPKLLSRLASRARRCYTTHTRRQSEWFFELDYLFGNTLLSREIVSKGAFFANHIVFKMHLGSACAIEHFVAECSRKEENCSLCRVWGNTVIFTYWVFSRPGHAHPIQGREPAFPGLNAKVSSSLQAAPTTSWSSRTGFTGACGAW